MNLPRGERRLRLIVATVGLGVAVGAGAVWFPRASAGWGQGPLEARRRILEVAHTFGERVDRVPLPTLTWGKGGAAWISSWRGHARSVTVALEPDGHLVGLRQAPSILEVDLPSSRVSDWLQNLALSLPQTFGRLIPDSTGSPPGATIVRPDGVALRLSVPPTSAGPLEVRSQTPLPSPRRSSPLPTIGLLVMVGTIASSGRAIARAVKAGRARAGDAPVLGAGVAGASLVGFLVLAACRGTGHGPVAMAIASAAAMGAAVLVGAFLEASGTSRPPRQGLGVWWVLVCASIGLASLTLALPHAWSEGLSGARLTGLPFVSAVLLAWSLGLAVERGLRPVVDEVFATRPALVRGGTVALAAGTVVEGVLPGPWWWTLPLSVIAALVSGVASSHFGRPAASYAMGAYVLGVLTLPGLATSTLGVLTSLAALIAGLAVVPMALGRRAQAPSPGLGQGEPAYVARLKDEARHAYALEVARELQSSLCVIGPAEARGFEVACLALRAQPPAADLCRILPIGRDRLGIVLAEVPAGGVQGAVQASIVATAAVASLSDGKNLGAVPAEIERVIATVWSGPGATVAFQAGVLDGRSKSFSLVDAGHRPVLLYRALAGRLERVVPQGDPLSTGPVDGKRTYEVATVQLVTKDLLIFHSDGLTALREGSEAPFTLEDVERIVLASPGATCAELARAIEDRLAAAGPPCDDVIVLFLRAK